VIPVSLSNELIDLDECVINALDLFIKNKIPQLNLGKFKRPLVVGSGNAAVTGKIIFEDSDAVFADEGNYIQKLKAIKNIDIAILISASGGKHAPIIAKELKKRKIKTILLTNNKDALAKNYVNKTLVLPKNPEPYTYNTSTYMGVILSKTKENPKLILDYIKKNIRPKIPKNLKKYDSYYFIIPNEFDSTRELFMTKFDELFCSKISGRVFTPDQTKHAKTIIPSNKELFISLDYNNKTWGTKRLNLKLPKNAGPATVMAITYYIIGNIQKQNPPYFKKNIKSYTKKVSKLFNQNIKPIVE
jgi:hypothetical protein|tara:strand:- start:1008 stop:1913 length:906 start_codon:yes stop_codon:yes gene_type:complete